MDLRSGRTQTARVYSATIEPLRSRQPIQFAALEERGNFWIVSFLTHVRQASALRGPNRISMKIRTGYEISYECPQPTPMILTLSVHPSRFPDLLVQTEARITRWRSLADRRA
jgi:hypothetical protein